MPPKKPATPSRSNRPTTRGSNDSSESNTPTTTKSATNLDIQQMFKQMLESLNEVKNENQNLQGSMNDVQTKLNDVQSNSKQLKSDLINHIDTTMEDKLDKFDEHLRKIDMKFDVMKLEFDERINAFETKVHTSNEDDSLSLSKSQTESSKNQQKEDDQKSEYSVGDNVWYKKDSEHLYKCKIVQKRRNGQHVLMEIHLTNDQGYFLHDHKDFQKTHWFVSEDELTRVAPRFAEAQSEVKDYSDKKQWFNEKTKPRIPNTKETQNPDPIPSYDDTDELDLLHRKNQPLANNNNLTEKTFVYLPRGSQTITVLDMYLPKLATKFNLHTDDDLITFYNTFRSRLETYNILLKDYSEIDREYGVRVLNFTNSINHIQANQVMSRAIFNFLDDKKDEIMPNYTYGYKLLKNYQHTRDGFAYLERLLERAHPKLRHPLLDSQSRPKPTLLASDSIFDFIHSYLDWLNYESQEIPPRTYSDTVKINYIISEIRSLNSQSLSLALNYITSKRDIAFCDPLHPLPLPIDLQLDRIANTILDRTDEVGKEELLSIDKRNIVQINKAIPLNQLSRIKNRQYTKEQKNVSSANPYKKSQDTSVSDANYRRRAIQKYCQACKMWGHDLPDCDSTSKQYYITKFLETVKDEPLQKTLDAYDRHQTKVRKKFKSKQRMKRRIQKLESMQVEPYIMDAAVMLCQDIESEDSSSDSMESSE